MRITRVTRFQSRLSSWCFAALFLLLVALLAWLSTRHPLEFDWTRSGRHTLSPASQEVLKRFDGPINVTAYAREDPVLRDAIRAFVGRYQRARSGITLEFVNPDLVPDEVRKLGISMDGELVIRHGARSEQVKSINEESFTNALQRLAHDKERWLTFLEGHGERKPFGAANHDLGEWVKHLSERGYRAQPLNPGEAHAIPDNTSVLILAGPQLDLLPGEVELIHDYLNRGGNLLWLTDPGSLRGLEPLAADLGIRFLPGVVVDVAGRLLGINDPGIALVTPSLYGAHAITRGLEFSTLYPHVAALTAEEAGEWQATTLLETGNHTWLESGELSGNARYDDGSELRGPLTIGIALERPSPADRDRLQRAVVIGDGDFLANAYLHNAGNLELGTRLVHWLASEDELITIPPKVAPDSVLELSPLEAGIIGFGFLFVLPALLFGTGLALAWRRRRR